MRDIALMVGVVVVGLSAATLVGWRTRRRGAASFLIAFLTAYTSIVAFADVFNICSWLHGRLYVADTSLQVLRILVLEKSPGILILSLICLAGPAALARVRRSARRA